jgi:hypothetical protein
MAGFEVTTYGRFCGDHRGVFLIRPAVKQIRARNPASNVLVPETGDTRHHDIRIHHGTLFSLLRLRQQR